MPLYRYAKGSGMIVFFISLLFLLACNGHHLKIDQDYVIVVDSTPFSSVKNAAVAEHRIDWSGDELKKMNACTQSFAALELQHYLKQLIADNPADSAFAILSLSDTLPPKSIVISDLTSAKKHAALSQLVERVNLKSKLGKAESFAIIPRKNRLYLIGSDRVGTLYSVYHLLETFGIHWYGPGKIDEVVPATPLVVVKNKIIEQPGFITRGFWAWEDRGSREFFLWMARNRLNFWTIAEPNRAFLKKLGLQLTVGGHQHFHDFLNPEDEYPYNHPAFSGDEHKPDDPYVYSETEYIGDSNNNGNLTYYEAHPEWYGLVNGERRTFKYEFGTNICTSNQDAVSELTKKMVAQLAGGAWRQANTLNFWPIDGGEWCECENCVPLGSPTDRLLVLVHQVYKAIEKATTTGRIQRDIQIIFPIYHETLPPPTHPLPKGFNYDKCIGTIFPIKRCYVHDLNDSTCTEYNQHIWNDFLGWTRQKPQYYKGDFFIGEYYNVSKIKSLPVLYMDIMSHDIPLYYQYGVRHAHYMHVYTSLLGMKRINNYLFAKLLWNPAVNTETLLQRYYRDVYGVAAKEMQNLYTKQEYAMSSVKQWRHTYHLADRINHDETPLFNLQHLKLKEHHPPLNDGVDLEESVNALKTCRKILDRVNRFDLPDKIRKRLEQDDQNLRYAENTVYFYYWFAKAILAKRDNDLQAAKAHFKTSLPFARGLKKEIAILQTASSHANAGNGLIATRVQQAYEQFGKELMPEWRW